MYLLSHIFTKQTKLKRYYNKLCELWSRFYTVIVNLQIFVYKGDKFYKKGYQRQIILKTYN